MAKYTEPTTVEQTVVGEKVIAATRVFLGFAIGMGFVASAMALFMIPEDMGGGGGSGSASGAPLKVAQILNVKTILNQGEQFVPLGYVAGSKTLYNQTTVIDGTQGIKLTSNQALSIKTSTTPGTNGNTNGGPTPFSIESIGGATTFSVAPLKTTTTPTATATPFSIESIGGSTPFSIEPVPQYALPSQMVVMEYKLVTDKPSSPTRKLTVCIGHTSVTNLYVGTDGSTYANSSFGTLTGRTTNESCATIKSRALKMQQITAGTIVQDVGSIAATANGDYHLLRAFIDLGRFTNGQFERGTSPVTLQTEAPLYAGFNFQTPSETRPASAAIMTLTEDVAGSTVTKTICFPQTTMDPTTGGPVYYYDNNGTPFHDIFLQDAVMSGSCADILNRALKMNQVDSGKIVSEGLTPAGDIFVQRSMHSLGRFTGGTFTRDVGTNYQGGSDPLVIAPSQSMGDAGFPITFPRSLLTLSGSYSTTTAVPPTPVSATLCYPETSWTSGATDARTWYYFDTQGNAYTDIFLQARAMTTACPDILAKALKINQVDSGSIINEGLAPAVDVYVQRSLHSLGRFTGGTFTREVGTNYQGESDPLVIAPVAPTSFLPSVTYPRSLITLTGSYSLSSAVPPTPVSVTVCYPETTWDEQDTATHSWYFYDTVGNPYNDIFLQQPAMTTACPDILAKALKISSVDSGTISVEDFAGLNAEMNVQRSYHMLGKFTRDTFTRDNTVPSYGTSDPLVLQPTLPPQTPAMDFTYPFATVTLTGSYAASTTVAPTPVTVTLCYPETSWRTDGDPRNWYFYDHDGQPYNDLFLTSPKACPAAAYSNAHVISANSTWTIIGWDLPRTGCSDVKVKKVSDPAATALTFRESADYGFDSATGRSIVTCGAPSHQAILTGLQPNTAYTYEVSRPLFNGTVKLDPQPFTTLATVVAAGGYTNIHTISANSSSVTIGWDTTRTSCSNVNYGVINNRLSIGQAHETAPCTGTTHRATIAGLSGNTNYLFEIVGLDGTTRVGSGVQVMTTLPSGVSSGTYANIHVISTTTNSATIGWDTTGPSCGRINYGTVAGALNSGPVPDSCYAFPQVLPGYTTGHQATITGLSAGQTYLYEIVSTNWLASGQLSFTTTAATSGGGGGSKTPLRTAE